MARNDFMLIVGDGAWRAARCGGDGQVEWRRIAPSSERPDAAIDATGPGVVQATANVEWLVDAALQALGELDHRGESLVVALPSMWCLCGSIALDGLPRQRHQRRTAMMYLLEEQLPVEVEQLACDFLVGPERRNALGVACRLDLVEPLVGALQARCIEAAAIVPQALLAVMAAADSGGLVLDQLDAVLIADERGTDLLILASGKPVDWQHLPKGFAQASAALDRIMIRGWRHLRLGLCGITGSHAEALGMKEGVDAVIVDPLDAAARTAQGARLVSRGRAAPWIDLVTGKLARGDRIKPIRVPLWTSIMALIVLGLCIAIAASWRAMDYEHRADQLRHQQERAFAAVLPGQPIPANITARLESEAARIRGLRGESADRPELASALELMHQTARRLPDHDTMRYRLLELRFMGDELWLEGQARSHGEADRLATSLRARRGLEVDPPRTEHLATRGVAFTLTGRYIRSETDQDRPTQEPRP